jgi:hypothetical protein
MYRQSFRNWALRPSSEDGRCSSGWERTLTRKETKWSECGPTVGSFLLLFYFGCTGVWTQGFTLLSSCSATRAILPAQLGS